MLLAPYNQAPVHVVKTGTREIHCFQIGNHEQNNIDTEVVQSFGEEWTKFNSFSENEISRTGDMYFDIIDDAIINQSTYGIDVGCGTGRWTKYLLPKIGFMEAIDPSDAILSANTLLGDAPNVRLTKAATDNLPFADETFDFGMSVGVLHHIPDTKKALTDCVKKIKIGGYFYVYLYYSLDNRGMMFKFLFWLVNVLRMAVSSLPAFPKRVVCDFLALVIYYPLVLIGRLFRAIGLPKIASKIPLAGYQNQTFFIIRNDALDRFGTTLEQRFSRKEIEAMMTEAGLTEIVIPDTLPYWHAIGKRIK